VEEEKNVWKIENTHGKVFSPHSCCLL